jgi:hypothetical protein
MEIHDLRVLVYAAMAIVYLGIGLLGGRWIYRRRRDILALLQIAVFLALAAGVFFLAASIQWIATLLLIIAAFCFLDYLLGEGS